MDSNQRFDVAVSQSEAIDKLIQEGKLVAGSGTDLVRTGLGIAARDGVPKADISTVEAFKRFLLDAKTFAYSKEGASGAYFLKLMDRLGIAQDMQARLVAWPTIGVVDVVGRGEAEFALAPIPSILLEPGIMLVGSLPAELQTWIAFSGGLVSGSNESNATGDLQGFLTCKSPLQKRPGFTRFIGVPLRVQ